MYVVWRPAGCAVAAFRAQLLDEVGPALTTAGARGVQVNVVDEAVAAGVGEVPAGLRRVATRPQMESVVSVWVDSSVGSQRASVERALVASDLDHAGYLVSESEPLRNTEHPPTPGERTVGFAQLALLRRPPAMTHDAWLERWHDHQTQVAIDTQSTFEYRQNQVVERLHVDAPPVDAIVEEGFPIEALTDRYAFYAARDDEQLQANISAMGASTRTFVDHAAGLDVLPTSQYVLTRAFR